MEKEKNLTHEKHLDHLVRVVPLLCFAYGVQSYLMVNMARGANTGNLIFTLGFFLAMSVMMLVTYDLKFKVRWDTTRLIFKAPWRFYEKIITFQEIESLEVVGKEDEFQTVLIRLHNRKKYVFYFVDNGHELQKSYQATLAVPDRVAA
jgi:hypothetical protein